MIARNRICFVSRRISRQISIAITSQNRRAHPASACVIIQHKYTSSSVFSHIKTEEKDQPPPPFVGMQLTSFLQLIPVFSAVRRIRVGASVTVCIGYKVALSIGCHTRAVLVLVLGVSVAAIS